MKHQQQIEVWLDTDDLRVLHPDDPRLRRGKSFCLCGEITCYFNSPAMLADLACKAKAEELEKRIVKMIARATDVIGDPLAKRMRELAGTSMGAERALELHARANELDDTDPLISPVIRLAQRERARRLWLDLTGEEAP